MYGGRAYTRGLTTIDPCEQDAACEAVRTPEVPKPEVLKS